MFFKKTFFLYILILIILIFYLIFLKPVDSSTGIQKFFPSKDSLYKNDLVDSIFQTLSLEEKIAQLIFPFGYSEFLNKESEKYKQLLKQVKHYKVGGFVFLTGDILSQAHLINDMQKNANLPLLVCADFEQGLGFRLKDAIEYPSAMTLAAANDDSLTYLIAQAISNEAKAIKVSVVFAPVLDVNDEPNNPVINIRAFSDDPYITSKHGIAFIKGIQKNNIIAVAKHFPGHGMTPIDSHFDLPIVNISFEDLLKKHIYPFQEAINFGVAGIMLAHVKYQGNGIADSYPASISSFFIENLLVNRFRFDGIIFTDALTMNAISSNFSNYEAAKLAINSGANVLLMPPENETLINSLVDGILANEVSENQLNKSVKKILEFKLKLGLFNDSFIDFETLKITLNRKSHHRLAKEAAEKSITIIKNNENLIPLTNYKKYSPIALIIIGNRKFNVPLPIEKEFKKKIAVNKVIYIESTSNELDFEKAVKISSSSKLNIIAHFVRYEPPASKKENIKKHKALAQKLISINKNSCVIILGNPYWAADYQNAAAVLLTYSGCEASQIAVAKAVCGENDIQGILPVNIPKISLKRGEGLKIKSNDIYDETKESLNYYNFDKIDDFMLQAVKDSVFPGAVLLIGKNNKIIYNKAFGNFTYEKTSPKTKTNTIFDLASVTKVVATTSAALILSQEGKLNIEDFVYQYLPQFSEGNKSKIKIKHLLTHQSGLKAFIPFYKKNFNKEQILDSISKSSLDFNPGEKYQYSDLGMIILQAIIEKITQKDLSQFCKERIFIPLEMQRTCFNPSEDLISECPPTEIDNYWRMKTIQGKVHDENAYLMRGISGHAGLFSTAEDLAKFCYLILNNGIFKNKVIFNSDTLSNWTSIKSTVGSRAFGWAVKSENSFFGTKASSSAIGHTGFTGTSIIIDKKYNLFIILLSNRTYPSRKNVKIIAFRPKLFNLIYETTTSY